MVRGYRRCGSSESNIKKEFVTVTVSLPMGKQHCGYTYGTRMSSLRNTPESGAIVILHLTSIVLAIGMISRESGVTGQDGMVI